nr:outer membrane beta-barrel protein [uncultured Desulfobulbus sp.]
MKKVLSVMAVSAFVMTAGVAFAGGPGKMDPACPEACQQQIDDLQSSQAQQNEELSAHTQQLDNHETRITALEALPGVYARVGGRLAWMDIGNASSDLGWGGALAIGQTYKNLRYELELAYQSTEIDNNGDADLATVMANAYYDFPIQNGFSAYAMVGMGYGHMDAEGFDKVNTMAYKAGVGVSYMFTDQVIGDLGYEYLGVTDSGAVKDVDGHNIVASVRFLF